MPIVMSEPRKVDRRSYVKYAAAGVVVVAGAAAGYYWVSTPNVKLDTNPKYMAATEEQPVDLLGEISDIDRSDLEYTCTRYRHGSS